MNWDLSEHDPWDTFLAKGIYREPLNTPAIKHLRSIGKNCISDLHPNPAEQGALAGKGKAYTRWVLCEQDWIRENICESAFSIVIDVYLEPLAGFGVHAHENEEELIYVLEGQMTATVVARDGARRTEEMTEGELLIIRTGEQHGGVAGPDGCRYLVIANKIPHGTRSN